MVSFIWNETFCSTIVYDTFCMWTLFHSDKSPQLLEFVNLIKGSPETSELFESIQQDTSSVNIGNSTVDSMDLS